MKYSHQVQVYGVEWKGYWLARYCHLHLCTVLFTMKSINCHCQVEIGAAIVYLLGAGDIPFAFCTSPILLDDSDAWDQCHVDVLGLES